MRQQVILDVAKVHGRFEVSVVEVREAGFLALDLEPALDGCPGDEQRPGGPAWPICLDHQIASGRTASVHRDLLIGLRK